MILEKLELPIKIMVYSSLIGSIIGYYYLPMVTQNYMFNFFLITWGLDKTIAYYLGKKIRIGPVVTINANSNEHLRKIGLVFGFLLISFGLFNLFS